VFGLLPFPRRKISKIKASKSTFDGLEGHTTHETCTYFGSKVIGLIVPIVKAGFSWVLFLNWNDAPNIPSLSLLRSVS
jgi:hypothetical protein